jgi:predicted GH43/DUF377 family glycosyl hydrolase
MDEINLKRLGVIMEPEPGNPHEVEGVLNPAAARGPDGHLYLFPRLVAKGNYSRIGIARVKFDAAGDPTGVERLGIALEPETDYELRPDGGGCEDPRVSFVEPLGRYAMSYTAFSPEGPRIALAVSTDLFHWERLGLASFKPYNGMKFDGIDNKDAAIFPQAVNDPSGGSAFAMLHRPLFPGTRPEEKACREGTATTDLDRESIWIAYRDLSLPDGAPYHLCQFTGHHRLAAPAQPWEVLKIGGGTPPILTEHGWLVVYHGVSDIAETADTHQYCYSAGLMILARDEPQRILFRSKNPVLRPESEQEKVGVIANVVFPTGIDRRDDLGTPNRFDVYYGMADDRIGVARLDLPATMPPSGASDPAASNN